MAESLQAFFKENAQVIENEKFVPSQRFQEDGKPLEWEIRAISAKEDERLRQRCMKRVVRDAGKRKTQTMELDINAYTAALCAACTVYPDLNNAALQDSYGVKGAEELLKVMLLPAEFLDYAVKVQELNGFDQSMEDKVNEAKN